MSFLSWLRRVSRLRKYYILRYHGSDAQVSGYLWRSKREAEAYKETTDGWYPIPTYISSVWE